MLNMMYNPYLLRPNIMKYFNLIKSRNNDEFNLNFKNITLLPYEQTIHNLDKFKNIQVGDKIYFIDGILQINKDGYFTSLYRYLIGTGRAESIIQLINFRINSK